MLRKLYAFAAARLVVCAAVLVAAIAPAPFSPADAQPGISRRVLPDTIPNAETSSTLMVATGSNPITVSRASHEIDVTGGSALAVSSVVATAFQNGDTVKITVASGDAVTFSDGTDNISTDTGADVVINAGEVGFLHVTASGVIASKGGGGDTPVTSVSGLNAHDSAGAGAVKTVGADNFSGQWVFSDGDLSALRTADPTEGVFLPLASDTDGSSGGWVRLEWAVEPGKLKTGWFGAIPDDSTDDSDEIEAAVDVLDALSTNGFLADSAGVVQFACGKYDIDATVQIPSSLDGVSFTSGAGSCAELAIAQGIVGFMVGEDLTDTGLFPGGDTASSDTIYMPSFTNLVFDAKSTTGETVAIQLNRAAFADISHNTFRNFWTTIVSHRINRGTISYNEIQNTGRTNADPAFAAFDFHGVYDSTNPHTPGGGTKLIGNEIAGNSSDLQGMDHGYYLRAGDGFYINGGTGHLVSMDTCVTVAPEGTAQNNKITDIKILNLYCDRHDGDSIELTGSLAAGGLFQDIEIGFSRLRGNGEAAFAVVYNTTDAGTFDGEVRNFQIHSNTINQFTSTAININGPETNSALPVTGVSIIGNTIFENNEDTDSAATCGIRSEAKSGIYAMNTFLADANACDRLIDIELDSATITRAASIYGNIASEANYDSEPYRLKNTGSGETSLVSGNIWKAGDEIYDIGHSAMRGTLDTGWDVNYSGGTATDPTVDADVDWVLWNGWVTMNAKFTFSALGTPDTNSDQIRFDHASFYLPDSSRDPFTIACQIDNAAASPATNPAIMGGPIAGEVAEVGGVFRLTPVVKNSTNASMIGIRADQVTSTSVVTCAGSWMTAAP